MKPISPDGRSEHKCWPWQGHKPVYLGGEAGALQVGRLVEASESPDG